MTRRIDRRQALGAFGTVTVEPETTTSPDTASRFGDESNYQGRTVHIHARVHLDNATALTTQLFFDDAVSDRVFAAAPYGSRGERQVRNGDDGIFDDALLLDLSREGDGFLGTISFDVAAS